MLKTFPTREIKIYLSISLGLYNKGLIYFDIPIQDKDHIVGKNVHCHCQRIE